MFFGEYIEDKTKSLRYKASLEAIMTRALGIDGNEINIFGN